MFIRKSFNLSALILFGALVSSCASQSQTITSDLNLNPEIIAWIKCSMAKKIELCESFLTEFPESKFKIAATKKMNDILGNDKQ